jgi:hypothetical protein
MQTRATFSPLRRRHSSLPLPWLSPGPGLPGLLQGLGISETHCDNPPVSRTGNRDAGRKNNDILGSFVTHSLLPLPYFRFQNGPLLASVYADALQLQQHLGLRRSAASLKTICATCVINYAQTASRPRAAHVCTSHIH